MSPMISNAKNLTNIADKVDNNFQNEKNKLIKIRQYIENNFENVGENFSSKVRDIYYDKNNNKTIYGTTTDEERKELADEGIDLLTIPWINKDN